MLEAAYVSAVNDSSHLWNANSMPGPLVRSLRALSISLEPHSYTMRQMYCQPHFKEEVEKAQRGSVACPRSHSTSDWRSQVLHPGALHARPHSQRFQGP